MLLPHTCTCQKSWIQYLRNSNKIRILIIIWMKSPTPWTRVGASFRSWWWTRKLGVLQSTGSQRVGRDWATETGLKNTSWGFPSDWVVKNPPANAGLSVGSGRSPRERNSYPLQYSCLGNPIDRWAWWIRAHRVYKRVR